MVDQHTGYVFANARSGGVKRAMAMLSAALDEARIGHGEAPAVDLAGLHPWVAGVSTALWSNGHRRQAVEEAARQIEVQLRAKLGQDGGTGVRLVTDAFSLTPSKPDSFRLRFEGFTEGTDGWTNAHEGAMSFGRGCMLRIRNLYLHGHEPPEAEVLEALAALSLLARWIDEAVTVSSE